MFTHRYTRCYKLYWYRWPDLNRHDLRHHPLKMACLPISPHRHNHLNLYFFGFFIGFRRRIILFFNSLYFFCLWHYSIFNFCTTNWSNGCSVDLTSGTAGISSDLISGTAGGVSTLFSRRLQEDPMFLAEVQVCSLDQKPRLCVRLSQQVPNWL